LTEALIGWGFTRSDNDDESGGAVHVATTAKWLLLLQHEDWSGFKALLVAFDLHGGLRRHMLR
jgi:hypothetical protein